MVFAQYFLILASSGTLLFFCYKIRRRFFRNIILASILLGVAAISAFLLYFQSRLSSNFIDDLLYVSSFGGAFAVELFVISLLLTKFEKLKSNYIYFIIPFIISSTFMNIISMIVLTSIHPGS